MREEKVTHIKRRDFLKILSIGGLTITVLSNSTGCRIIKAAIVGDYKEMFVPNVWLHISEDDNVIVIVNKSEMGQGVYTSLPMIVADELGANWEKINVLAAPAKQAYTIPTGSQETGGSTSIRLMYEPLRLAGASAREMLIEAAANKWKEKKSNCYTKDGKVISINGKEINFGSLVQYAKKLTPPQKPVLKNEEDFNFIGKSMKRVDTLLKVNGKAEFGIDIFTENMVYAVVKRPLYYGSKIIDFDKNSVKNIKGFIDAFNISRGVAITAKTIDAALKAKELIQVDTSPGIMPELDTNYIEKALINSINRKGIIAQNIGNVEQNINEAATKIESDYLLPYLAHANMEPMNCTAVVSKDFCKIWTPTQSQTDALQIAKKITGLPENKIYIYTTYLGTGLGRRSDVDYVGEAVEISKNIGLPVKLLWTREDDFTHDFYRPASYSVINAGLDARGRLLSWKHKIAVPSLWERIDPTTMKNGIDNAAVDGLRDLVYDVPNLYVEFIKVDLPVPVGFWRSVGKSHNVFIVESFMDELAFASKNDPLEFRIQHLSKHKRAINLLKFVADKIKWSNKEKDCGYGIALLFGYDSYVVEAAKVRLDNATGNYKIDKIIAGVDCGNVINPQIVKDQILSGIIMGLSAALKEKMEFKNGGPAVENFFNYNILSQLDVPNIEVYIIESDEKVGGIGEAGLPLAAPAVVNAIFDLTGIRYRNLPLTLNI